jgi:carbamoyl-phosphate synthase large subunit
MIKNILVTGAGALLGQGILRSLSSLGDQFKIHTCDPHWRSGGHWLGCYAHKIPMADDKSYLNELKRIIRDNQIDILFVGTDTELPLLAQKREEIEKEFGLKIVISDKKVIDIGNDKWQTANFLKDNGFPFPYSVLSTDKKGIADLKNKAAYPYFAKPVDGARSKGIVRVDNEDILNEITKTPNNLVIQEYISDEHGEFTSGCLVLGGHPKAVVTLKRDLRDGNTYRAFYDKKFSQYDDFIKKVSKRLGIEGPCNFQFRIRDNEPVIFEINARFSGTTPLRDLFGFNEVKATLEYYLFNRNIQPPVIKEGEVLRVWSDLFISKEEVERFENVKDILSPQAIYFPFKANL